MHITKQLYSKTILSIALVSISNLTFADNSTSQQESNITNGGDNIILTASKRSAPSNDDHLKEHGGQIYQLTRLENAWLVDEDGKGNLGTRFDTLIGTDENRLFIEANLDKAESNDPKYDVSALYSRNVAPFWDVQAGVRYSEDKNNRNSNRIDGVIGLLGLAPYFFETKAYLYGGENNFWGASFDVNRDLLLTQKLITQPYIEADIVLNDNSDFASKTGLSGLKTGIKTRYEITKRIRPFVDVAYQYEKGLKETRFQQATDSKKGWLYGAGIQLIF
ncbi:copper resistance protein B [Acinetobacter sp. NEB 394]|uniref:copper resistance protein B n=1 Tax=Acinetobacter sp. NEB 394 TaxID=2743575 RepID=UPI0015969D00|nr:copper resistance protein B [Acinetobacter sp. NEB 394]QKY92240.1 copper resistance protein B [Acinetobacter sp. NEB 394]